MRFTSIAKLTVLLALVLFFTPFVMVSCSDMGIEEEYFHTARHLQEDYAGVLNVLVGLEYGYDDDTRAHKAYLEVTEK